MIILDSCIWIALAYNKDPSHKRAWGVVEKLEDFGKKTLVVNNYIYSEVLINHVFPFCGKEMSW